MNTTHRRTGPLVRNFALLGAMILWLALAANVAANDIGDTPDAALRSLAMDPLDAYDDYDNLWLAATPASAEDLTRWRLLVGSLAEKTPADLGAKCGYRVWTTKNEKPWREETYLPREPSPWALVSVDGASPDPKALKTYLRDKEKAARKEAKERRRAKRRGEPHNEPFHPMGVLDMLEALPEPDVVMQNDGGGRFFGLRPDPAAEDPMRRGVQITVGVDGAGSVVSIDLRSFEPFDGGGGVRIERMHQRLLLNWDDLLHLPVVRFHERVMDAKVLRVVKVRDHTVQWYADVGCREL